MHMLRLLLLKPFLLKHWLLVLCDVAMVTSLMYVDMAWLLVLVIGIVWWCRSWHGYGIDYRHDRWRWVWHGYWYWLLCHFIGVDCFSRCAPLLWPGVEALWLVSIFAPLWFVSVYAPLWYWLLCRSLRHFDIVGRFSRCAPLLWSGAGTLWIVSIFAPLWFVSEWSSEADSSCFSSTKVLCPYPLASPSVPVWYCVDRFSRCARLLLSGVE